MRPGAKDPMPPRLVVARTTFVASRGSVVAEGDLYDAAHPIVADRPELFRPAEEVAIRH